MKRNSGIIGDKQSTNTTNAKGVHDIHDQSIQESINKWPKALTLRAASGSNTVAEGNNWTYTAYFDGGEIGDNLPYEITTLSGSTMTNADFSGIVVSGGTIALQASSWIGDTMAAFNPILVQGDGTENNTFKLTIYRGSPVTSDNIIHETNTITVTDTAGVDETFNLVTSSAPTGITITSGASISSGFSSSYGFMTAGNAVNFSYPLSLTDSHIGNRLFQASVSFPNNCADPGLAMWVASQGRNHPAWSWNYTNSTAAVFQTNCTTRPQIGTPNGGTGGSSLSGAIGNTITLHFWHHQTAGVMRGKVTLGADDWSITGTALGGTSTPLSVSYSTSSAVYFGVSSDYDNASLGSGSTNFKKLRIRDDNFWVAP